MKEKGRCLYVATKVYYSWNEMNEIKYGANSNGPPAWRDFVQFFEKNSHITYSCDFKCLFEEFFKKIYEQILDNCEATNSFEPFDYLTQDIKITTRPSTIELREYLNKNYKSVAGNFRQKVYFFQDPNDMLKTIYRPAVEINSMENLKYNDTNASIRQNGLLRLQQINMFKFFYPLFRTIFNLMSFHIKKNNRGFHVFLNDARVRYMMLRAYQTTFTKMYEQLYTMSVNKLKIKIQLKAAPKKNKKQRRDDQDFLVLQTFLKSMPGFVSEKSIDIDKITVASLVEDECMRTLNTESHLDEINELSC